MSASNSESLQKIMEAVDHRAETTIQMLQELVRIPSVTGQELAVQEAVQRMFQERNLEVDRWVATDEEFVPYRSHVGHLQNLENRPVLVGKRKGAGSGQSILLNAHIDTVPEGDHNEWDYDPFGAAIDGDLLFGRGSADMKAGLVTFLAALDAIDAAGVSLAGDVLINSVPGEEGSGYGTLSTVLRGYRADAAVISEPTRLRLVPATGGLITCRLRIFGKAAHGASRDEGVSAVEKFIPVFQGIMELEKELNAKRNHPLYDWVSNKAPISFGIVQSGNWPSTVPEELTAIGRVGLLPGESVDEIKAVFEQRVRDVAEKDPWLREHPPRVEWLPRDNHPAEIPADSAICEAIRHAFNQVEGSDPIVQGVTYGADTRMFTLFTDVPCVMFGAGDIAVAHRANEHISTSDLIRAVKVVAALLVNWTAEKT